MCIMFLVVNKGKKIILSRVLGVVFDFGNIFPSSKIGNDPIICHQIRYKECKLQVKVVNFLTSFMSFR